MNQFEATSQFVTDSLNQLDFFSVGLIVDVNFTLTPNGGKIISRELDDAVQAGVRNYLDQGVSSMKLVDLADRARALVNEIRSEGKTYGRLGDLIPLADAIDYWFVEGYYEGLASVAQDREIYGEDF